jgi:putative transposon-encoded protein
MSYGIEKYIKISIDNSIMARIIELNKGNLLLREKEIEGFLERIVTPIGTSAKADVPRRYLNRRVYVVITKKTVRKR